jgi:dimethylglycine dehydrogenase
MAGRVPGPGRLSLSPMLAPSGRIMGDFTISCLAEDDFRLTASYGAQDFHMRWFDTHMEGRGHGRERLGPDHGLPDRGAARA